MEEAPIEQKISATIKELDSAGRIKYKGIKNEDMHHEFMKDWGHVVRVTPADVNFVLREGEEIDGDKKFALWPDKPLSSIVVENIWRAIGDTHSDDPHVTNIRMGAGFYRIHMNPEMYYSGPRGRKYFRMEIHRV